MRVPSLVCELLGEKYLVNDAKKHLLEFASINCRFFEASKYLFFSEWSFTLRSDLHHYWFGKDYCTLSDMIERGWYFSLTSVPVPWLRLTLDDLWMATCSPYSFLLTCYIYDHLNTVQHYDDYDNQQRNLLHVRKGSSTRGHLLSENARKGRWTTLKFYMDTFRATLEDDIYAVLDYSLPLRAIEKIFEMVYVEYGIQLNNEERLCRSVLRYAFEWNALPTIRYVLEKMQFTNIRNILGMLNPISDRHHNDVVNPNSNKYIDVVAYLFHKYPQLTVDDARLVVNQSRGEECFDRVVVLLKNKFPEL